MNWHQISIAPTAGLRIVHPLSPYWSLAVEEQFYAIIGVIYLGVRHLRRPAYAMLAITACAWVGGAATALFGNLSTTMAEWGTHVRAPEIAAGVILACVLFLAKRQPIGRAADLLGWGAFVTLLTLFVLADKTQLIIKENLIWALIYNLLAIPVAMMLLRESIAERSPRLDVPGALLLAVGLLALVVPLIEGQEYNWPWWCVVPLTLSMPLLWIFWQYEKAQELAGRTPLVLPSLLAVRGLRRSLASTFFFYALAAFFLVFALYEQAGLGHDALAAGLAILPLGIGFFLGPLCSPRIARRMGSRTAGFGMALEVLGLVMVAALAFAGMSSWLTLPLFLIGAGQGIALPALVRMNVDHVESHMAGLASGLVNATLQISAAVSVALFGGLFMAIAPNVANAQDVQFGFAVVSLAIGLSLALAAVLSWRCQETISGIHIS